MIIRFNELKARCADQGRRLTLDEIAAETGIQRRMVDKLAAGDYGLINPQYVDALWTFFRQQLPGLEAHEFIVPEVVGLPIQVGERGVKRKGTNR